MFKTVEYKDGKVRLIDQTRLPLEEVYVECDNYQDVARAIKIMQVRGAPAIGVTAAMGVALGAKGIITKDFAEFYKEFVKICDYLAGTRPTAVNLFWAIERMKSVTDRNRNKPVDYIKDVLEKEAVKIREEDISINRTMGNYGQELIENGDTILTHCNAGVLATAGEYGTALGVIKVAHEKGKKIKVYADETRPFLQGARLTAWELVKEGIPVRLITDNMAGYFMGKGEIDKVIVGADRIAANGDTANKIGTYSLSILSKEHNIPFYVAAPLSTIDIKILDGSKIPIEERNPQEVTHLSGKRIAPEGVEVSNPAFDVTPNKNITAIITEKGIIKPPFKDGIKGLFK
ncbi:MAG: S-methyl-5-thioribose-1-phosphate isomerase [Nitrospinae bacterium]|nr:S-methyl-5-thioribose-1-phosphate isomerase [Nitrospinota bacterium]